jgi:hypothetical protein
MIKISAAQKDITETPFRNTPNPAFCSRITPFSAFLCLLPPWTKPNLNPELKTGLKLGFSKERGSAENRAHSLHQHAFIIDTRTIHIPKIL